MTETQEIALRDYNNSGRQGEIESKVFHAIVKLQNCTDREIEQETGLDINKITRARNDLIYEGFVKHGNKRSCEVTGSYVQSWGIGKQEKLASLSNQTMEKIRKHIENANSFQLNRIVEMCGARLRCRME